MGEGLILFSPAAASFDEFLNFEDRGRAFTSYVKERFNFQNIDVRLMFPVVMILVIGYIMIFSTTSFKGLSEFNDAYYLLSVILFICWGELVCFYWKCNSNSTVKAMGRLGYVCIHFVVTNYNYSWNWN